MAQSMRHSADSALYHRLYQAAGRNFDGAGSGARHATPTKTTALWATPSSRTDCCLHTHIACG